MVNNDAETKTETVTGEQVETEEPVDEAVEAGCDEMDMEELNTICQIKKTEHDSNSSDDSQSVGESDGDVTEAKSTARKGKTRQACSISKIKQFLQKIEKYERC